MSLLLPQNQMAQNLTDIRRVKIYYVKETLSVIFASETFLRKILPKVTKM